MRKWMIGFLFVAFGCADHNTPAEPVESQSLVESQTLVTSKCELVPEAGPCKAYFKKYYFDKSEGKCKEFVWGGCGGVVPFETLEECKSCEGSR